jgi:hypothetical protein
MLIARFQWIAAAFPRRRIQVPVTMLTDSLALFVRVHLHLGWDLEGLREIAAEIEGTVGRYYATTRKNGGAR